jgi:hypothetical protein
VTPCEKQTEQAAKARTARRAVSNTERRWDGIEGMVERSKTALFLITYRHSRPQFYRSELLYFDYLDGRMT